MPRSFYTRDDVLTISRELLGKVLVTNFTGVSTSGIIVETEAYQGIGDKAAHSFGGRRTPRTEIMYAQGGTAYVYLIYGIHHLFNVVTNKADTPHAILIRALEPLEGIDIMLHRRDKLQLDFTLTKGPGALSQAMGIHKSQTGVSLMKGDIWIEDRGIAIPKNKIMASPRIGVEYAGDHAEWLYRFYVKDNPWVPVTALPGQIVVNVGDMLQRLTNDVLRSTTHRVVNPPRELWGTSRFSIPFFLHPRSEMKLDCLPQCVNFDNPRKYDNITAGEYLDERLVEIGLKKA